MPFSKTPSRVAFDGDGYVVEEGRWDAGGDTSAEVVFDNSGNFSAGNAQVRKIVDAEFYADVAGNDVIVSNPASKNDQAVDITMLGTDTGTYRLRGKAA